MFGAKFPPACKLLRRHCSLIVFSLDRVNFLASIWYSAVFWVQCNNNINNSLVF